MVAKSALLKGVHAHGCPKCKVRFEDFCSEPWLDPLCISCRAGALRTSLEAIENRQPKDCCKAFSRLARKEEIERFRLGSTCAWYFCNVCARTHPFRNPKESQA